MGPPKTFRERRERWATKAKAALDADLRGGPTRTKPAKRRHAPPEGLSTPNPSPTPAPAQNEAQKPAEAAVRLSPATAAYLEDLRRRPPSARPLMLGVLSGAGDHMVPNGGRLMREQVKRAVFNPEQLKVLGRAPVCPACPDTYMAPVNDPARPDLCRCLNCGAEAHFRWAN